MFRYLSRGGNRRVTLLDYLKNNTYKFSVNNSNNIYYTVCEPCINSKTKYIDCTDCSRNRNRDYKYLVKI